MHDGLVVSVAVRGAHFVAVFEARPGCVAEGEFAGEESAGEGARGVVLKECFTDMFYRRVLQTCFTGMWNKEWCRVDVPICVECHAILFQNGHQIILASATEEVILALIDRGSDVSLFVAYAHPFLRRCNSQGPARHISQSCGNQS